MPHRLQEVVDAGPTSSRARFDVHIKTKLNIHVIIIQLFRVF
jgi:hypothetical protein